MANIQGEFKKIDDILYEDAGTNGANDYMSQISWILFLKYLDEYEQTRKDEAQLVDTEYTPLFDDKYQWQNWAAPKLQNGKPDLSAQISGQDLVDFVNNERDGLFQYLRSFKNTIDDPKDIRYKIGEIFGEVSNKIQSGINLREVIDIIDELEFKRQDELDDLSALYEDRLKLMGNAGQSGEYYTPRPLIQALIKAVNPELGKTIYDGAAGSAGFLTEAYAYLRNKVGEHNPSQLRFLKQDTFFGKNKKPEPYLIGTMNMILHGIESPNMVHTNTLTENTQDLQERDRFDYILANPPFGGKERPEIQRNFAIKSSETANLFMQHFMKKLKVGGEAAIVIKNTFLTNEPFPGATGQIRKELLDNFNLHTILDLPQGVFRAGSGTGVKTVVLFFKKGEPTTNIFYYKFEPERSLGKTSPLVVDDLADFLEKHKTHEESEHSWNVSIDDIDKTTYDLGVHNPNEPEAEALKSPKEILAEIKNIDLQISELLDGLEV